MAGYSGTPLPRKLGIESGHAVGLIGAPEGFAETLGELPEAARVQSSAGPAPGPFDVAVRFTKSREVLAGEFAALARAIRTDGMLWIAWPKRASRVPTDLDENVVREIGLEAGLVDVKVCAIDETWSGLKFVYRLADRPARRADGNS